MGLYELQCHSEIVKPIKILQFKNDVISKICIANNHAIAAARKTAYAWGFDAKTGRLGIQDSGMFDDEFPEMNDGIDEHASQKDEDEKKQQEDKEVTKPKDIEFLSK